MTQKKEDGDKFKTSKAKLAEMVAEARKKILQGNLNQAHDQLFKFITEQKDKLGGDDSVFLIPGLLTIAQIHIIQGRNKKAEQYLNAAQWSFLKYNDKSQTQKKKNMMLTAQEQLQYKIGLHRTFAKLYEVKNDFKEAINQLKNSVYLQSTRYGPQHPYVAQNYFLMGKVFIDMGNQPAGQAFFAKVAQIWYRYLKNFFQLSIQDQQAYLVQYHVMDEGINYLTYIEKYYQENYEEQQGGIVFTPAMRTYYAIGLLYRIYNDEAQCQGYLKQVYRRCLKYLPQDHRKTAEIKSLLQEMNVDINATPQPMSPIKDRPKSGEQLLQYGQDD